MMASARIAVVGRWWLIAGLMASAVACTDPGPRVAEVTPAYGPLSGGTRIRLRGAGFADAGLARDRVLVGGRVAPLVVTVNDNALDVIIPPGQRAGDAEILVVGSHGSAIATGLFHYSTPPTITAVSPDRVMVGATTTQVVVSGTGFLDEDAGPPAVFLGDVPVPGVIVDSDSRLRFFAPDGAMMTEPVLTVANQRGRASTSRTFRYLPPAARGLWLFTDSDPTFAVFFDPVTNRQATIPRRPFAARLTTVVRDEAGDYWAVDRSRRFGRVNWQTQQLDEVRSGQAWYPTMIRSGADYLALSRLLRRFGRVDPQTADFTPIGTTQLPCCGSYGLAVDDAGVTYFTTRSLSGAITISTIDPVTGTPGTAVPTVNDGSLHVEEMRFFDGTLYAVDPVAGLITIDPVTGVTTVVTSVPGRCHAMELYSL